MRCQQPNTSVYATASERHQQYVVYIKQYVLLCCLAMYFVMTQHTTGSQSINIGIWGGTSLCKASDTSCNVGSALPLPLSTGMQGYVITTHHLLHIFTLSTWHPTWQPWGIKSAHRQFENLELLFLTSIMDYMTWMTPPLWALTIATTIGDDRNILLRRKDLQ